MLIVFAGGEDRAGDAEVVREADLHRLERPAPTSDQSSPRLLVVQEQRRALGVEHAASPRP